MKHYCASRFTSGAPWTCTVPSVYRNTELRRLPSESSFARIEILWQRLCRKKEKKKRWDLYLWGCGLKVLGATLKCRWTSDEVEHTAVLYASNASKTSTDSKKKKKASFCWCWNSLSDNTLQLIIYRICLQNQSLFVGGLIC